MKLKKENNTQLLLDDYSEEKRKSVAFPMKFEHRLKKNKKKLVMF